VLERGERPGGMAGSFEVGGVRVDHGSHRLHPSIAPPILADLRALLGDDLQIRTRHGRVRLAGRWVGFPPTLSGLASQLPLGVTAGAAGDAATSWVRSPHRDPYGEVLRAGLGPTLCEQLYFPYARTLWGREPDELSGEAARRRVGAGSPGKLVARIAGRRSGAGHSFLYPRRGYGQISEALARACREAGVDVRLSTPATRVAPSPDGVTVHTDPSGGSGQPSAQPDQASDGVCLTAKRVWSTVPVTALARLVDPPPPPEVAQAAAQLSFRGLVLVYLCLDTPRYSRFDAHYLPASGTPVTRISEPTNYRHAPSDDGVSGDPPGRTVLCAEVPCEPGDELWGSGDGELAELVRAGMRSAGMAAPTPVKVAVKRLPKAYPVYHLGFEEAFAAVDAWVAGQPRVLTLGRQGLFAHDNAHHALTMAWAAADALTAEGDFDDAAWEHARQRFATHVVQD
jgi:protoporphyrinogen oxidase